jgi:hypothetical protein
MHYISSETLKPLPLMKGQAVSRSAVSIPSYGKADRVAPGIGAVRADLGRILTLADTAHARAVLAGLSSSDRIDIVAALLNDIEQIRRSLLADIALLRPTGGFERRRATFDVEGMLRESVRALAPYFALHNQTTHIDRFEAPIDARGDEALAAAAFRAVAKEVADLSMPRARLSVAVDADEGDVVITVLGRYPTLAPWRSLEVTPDVLERVTAAGASVEAFWEANDGPTMVMRFPLGR